MKKMLAEFKTFISKGNVLDMAIGVIIATAFGKITTALVNDVLMPVIGAIFGGSSLTDALNITLRPAVVDAATGEVVQEASVLGLGIFLNAIIDFLIVAFICFLIVKAFNKAKEAAEKKKKAEEEAAAAAKAAEEAAKPKEPTAEELLKEIRDLLKERK